MISVAPQERQKSLFFCEHIAVTLVAPKQRAICRATCPVPPLPPITSIDVFVATCDDRHCIAVSLRKAIKLEISNQGVNTKM